MLLLSMAQLQLRPITRTRTLQLYLTQLHQAQLHQAQLHQAQLHLTQLQLTFQIIQGMLQ